MEQAYELNIRALRSHAQCRQKIGRRQTRRFASIVENNEENKYRRDRYNNNYFQEKEKKNIH